MTGDRPPAPGRDRPPVVARGLLPAGAAGVLLVPAVRGPDRRPAPAPVG